MGFGGVCVKLKCATFQYKISALTTVLGNASVIMKHNALIVVTRREALVSIMQNFLHKGLVVNDIKLHNNNIVTNQNRYTKLKNNNLY